MGTATGFTVFRPVEVVVRPGSMLDFLVRTLRLEVARPVEALGDAMTAFVFVRKGSEGEWSWERSWGDQERVVKNGRQRYMY